MNKYQKETIQAVLWYAGQGKDAVTLAKIQNLIYGLVAYEHFLKAMRPSLEQTNETPLFDGEFWSSHLNLLAKGSNQNLVKFKLEFEDTTILGTKNRFEEWRAAKNREVFSTGGLVSNTQWISDPEDTMPDWVFEIDEIDETETHHTDTW